jgi:hypothetical protein
LIKTLMKVIMEDVSWGVIEVVRAVRGGGRGAVASPGGGDDVVVEVRV